MPAAGSAQGGANTESLRDWNDFGPCPLACTSTEVCCSYHDPIIVPIG